MRISETKRNPRDGKPDACFYVTYNQEGKKVWEKIGWKSEGYTAQFAQRTRADRVQAVRQGEGLPPTQQSQVLPKPELVQDVNPHLVGIRGGDPPAGPAYGLPMLLALVVIAEAETLVGLAIVNPPHRLPVKHAGELLDRYPIWHDTSPCFLKTSTPKYHVST
jgi:hypothetical protein